MLCVIVWACSFFINAASLLMSAKAAAWILKLVRGWIATSPAPVCPFWEGGRLFTYRHVHEGVILELQIIDVHVDVLLTHSSGGGQMFSTHGALTWRFGRRRAEWPLVQPQRASAIVYAIVFSRLGTGWWVWRFFIGGRKLC